MFDYIYPYLALSLSLLSAQASPPPNDDLYGSDIVRSYESRTGGEKKIRGYSVSMYPGSAAERNILDAGEISLCLFE